ncbi:MAG: PQQ-dependent sugar dehydrogenase [Pirellulaceae bacterium]
MAVFPRIGSVARSLRWLIVRLVTPPACWILAATAIAAGLLAVGGVALWPRPALPVRVMAEEVVFPMSPPGSAQWASENIFPQHKFFEPTAVAIAADGSRRVLVLERRGTVALIRDEPASSRKTEILDFSSQVIRTPYDDDGALNLVLHPQFGQADSPHRGYFYIYYTADRDGVCYDRLSRFTLGDDDRVDPDSEVVLIDQRDRNLWHNGSGLAFGADGFLYVGMGDEGGDSDSFENGQKIDKNLFSGILRIDVDRRGGDISHAPKRQPDNGETADYFIPNDNPFVGMPGVLEEFWAIGFRNPHRFAFDERRQLWVGDVGQILREEIDVVTAGSNCGWSHREGNLPFDRSYLKGRPPAEPIGVATPPLFEYPHVNGNNCVIGGYVYDGQRYPQLRGKYLYADNGSGRIFALEFEGSRVIANHEIASLPVSSKTGISSLTRSPDGELWIVVLGQADETAGTIHRLVPREPGTGPQLPRRLSETGLFSDVVALTPSPGVIPYDVNTPLWSDGAKKSRWIVLPGDGTDPDPAIDRVTFQREQPWKFPDGTIFVKHFELPIDENDPAAVKRLETRVLVQTSGGSVYGVTYKWNEEGTDATLLDGALEETIDIATTMGSIRQERWQYPDRQTCLVCHNNQAGYVLGVSTRQLNREVTYPQSGVTANQLAAWSESGMFTETLSTPEIEQSPSLAAINDAGASLEHRARSYLDANCASCHRPGIARANFDARYTTPLAEQGLIYGRVNSQESLPGSFIVAPGNPARSMLVQRMLYADKRMPPVAVHHRDLSAIGLLCEWIDQLPPGTPPAATETLADSPHP